MLDFVICDDEAAVLSLMEAFVREWAVERKHETEITLCRNAEQFLFQWEEKAADIVLLDIDMPGMDGISLARRLRGAGADVQIIFVTGLGDYVLEGYDVEAVSYLIKPVEREKLFGCLDKAWERCRKREPVLLLETAEGLMRVKYADICYLESDAHNTQVHCVCHAVMRTGAQGMHAGGAGSQPISDGIKTIRSRVGIQELENRLAAGSNLFFRIHRSYVVNLAWIGRISRKEVLMDTKETLPVSRNRWEALNQAYLKYYGMESGFVEN